MKKNCRFCLEEFDAKRSTAKFCSDICRTNFGRGISATSGMTLDEIRSYKKKEMELNLDNFPVIEIEAPVDNPVTGPGMEELTQTIQETQLEKKLKNNKPLSSREEDLLNDDVAEEDVITRIRKGMPINVHLTHLRQYHQEGALYERPHNVCYVPTVDEYEKAKVTIKEYEDQFPDTTKEHMKPLNLTTTQCMCSFCGERYASMNGRCTLMCKYCRTKDQRDKEEKAEHAVFIMEMYKRHSKEHDMYECPICNTKI